MKDLPQPRSAVHCRGPAKPDDQALGALPERREHELSETPAGGDERIPLALRQ